MKTVRRMLVLLFACGLLLVAGVIFLRVSYLERGVPVHEIEEWVEAEGIGTVLAVFAHQDDELLVAGTLAGLDAAGVDTALLTVTDGDGERRRQGQTVEKLVEERAEELRSIGRVLRIDGIEQGFFSDAGFMDVPDEAVKKVILEHIERTQPDTIITWDTVKGLYGHPHHVRVGHLVVELCRENRSSPDFPVKAVYGSTVSVWIREALKRLSPMYQRRYYEIGDEESIEPEFSLRTAPFADDRRAAFAVYSKRGAVRGLNPLSGFPTFVEDFVFDREYFYRSH